MGWHAFIIAYNSLDGMQYQNHIRLFYVNQDFHLSCVFFYHSQLSLLVTGLYMSTLPASCLNE